jgi:hypothetical protein
MAFSISDLIPECISFAKYLEHTSADADLNTLDIIVSYPRPILLMTFGTLFSSIL